MSLNLGQYRSTNSSSYGSAVEYTDTTINTTVSGIVFNDLGLSVTLDSNKKYYLSVDLSIAEGTGPIKVQIILKKTLNEITQTIKTVEITDSTVKNCELSFTPNQNYDLLVFQIVRNQSDLTIAYSISKSIVAFNTLTNILDSIGVSALQKIGIQGQPGLIININGEEIHIGRTGIYEMLDTIEVTFLGIASPDYGFFLIDYQY